jgi:acyl carrier protein
MNQTQLLAVLQSAHERVSATPATLRHEQRIIDDLGMDSLQQMELLSELEQTLELEIVGAGQLVEVKTVGELLDLLAALTDAAAVVHAS